MVARNVRVKLRVGSAPAFIRLLAEEIIPRQRTQKGFQDEISFVADRRNEAMAISFWDNQDSADSYNHVAYLDALRALSDVVESMPIVETFEVVGSAWRGLDASRA